MCHFDAINTIERRLESVREYRETHMSDLSCGALHAPETDRIDAEIVDLESDLARLRREQRDYDEGYRASRAHNFGGRPMQPEWRGRSEQFHKGFDQARQDG